MEAQETLVPIEEYLKVGLHIGTKFRTKAMQPFIHKIRPDGLAVLDIQKINEKLIEAAKYLAEFQPHEIIVACRRENGWRPAKLFQKATGIQTFTGRYPPGILTNTKLENFTEAKLLLIADPFPDKNAIKDAKRVNIKIIGLCDTNNETDNIDLVIPCNNKGKKSLGLLFYVLAREYLKARELIKKDEEFPYQLEDFYPQL